ncbi:ferritin-like domain-containing protein [Pedobacter foliorum]|uniref:ferritin-like domain-containing protein n=1 Tax=Pedobacter foliorum TaxID=2739058 RepID=UPI0015640AE3|nr:ferritin-like domain-containing protein [Pedobacter foliorum]NRF41468.1 ferritin-like domain-containing protein [Pedobacter foliorum]
MHDSLYWTNYFDHNLKNQRIDWSISPNLTQLERNNILKSLQAWQLGETSEGINLVNAATKHAKKLNDLLYVDAIKLFIKEEQKHGNNLGRYIDLIGEQRIKKDWGDSLFRKIRGLNTHMEFWTIAVITVESTAQIFYQCLKDATKCKLLQQICTDILIDEAAHITFQIERLSLIYSDKGPLMRTITYYFYTAFYFSTAMVVWLAHRKLFNAGQVHFSNYWLKMKLKFKKTIKKLKPESENINIENTFSHLL